MGSTGRQKVKQADVASELLPGVSVELLKALHILTRDGDLNADARRKLKQVAHLLHLLKPALEDVLARFPDPIVVDCGAGKGYLGFLLDAVYLVPKAKGSILAVESRADLAERAQEIASAQAGSRLRFVTGALDAVELPERVHLVTALHACDTATDDALYLAIKHRADHVAVVPCCQAEVADLLKRSPAKAAAAGALFLHPWHRREFGSHLTNVMRALALEAYGYQVTVTELAGWEHSLKNELILGKRIQREDAQAKARLMGLVETFGVKPKLLTRLLEP
ncbi:MAG: SAM-dependent methyltransferase [Myxococcota bacterium]